MKTAFVFPGQGSQRVGMGRELHEAFPSVRTMFERASARLGIDMAKLCFEGPESELILTENVQPAVTLVSLACHEVATAAGVRADVAAGHSLGEYAALYSAGVMSFDYVLDTVRRRGELMRDAAAEHPGGMLAVMGLKPEHFDAVCAAAAAAGHVEVANLNSPGQVIFTGETSALEVAADAAKRAGAVYSVPLKVSGPWHSRFMTGAAERMREHFSISCFGRPTIPVVANVTGDYYRNVAAMRDGLVAQIASPVQWVATIERLVADGVGRFVELGPGALLAGLIRDIDKSVEVFSIETPDGLERLLAACANDGECG